MDVILLRGAPGIGKSTIGELLRSSFPNGAVVDIDDMRRMICSENFLYKADHDYSNAVRASCALVEVLLDSGYAPIIVVDVLSSRMWEMCRMLLNGRQMATVVLFADDETLVKRMANRGNGYVNVEVAKVVNRQISEERDKGDAWIDTSSLSPRRVADAVIQALDEISSK